MERQDDDKRIRLLKPLKNTHISKIQITRHENRIRLPNIKKKEFATNSEKKKNRENTNAA